MSDGFYNSKPPQYDKVLELLYALGLDDHALSKKVCVHEVDEHWYIALNLTEQYELVSPQGRDTVNLAPYRLCVWYDQYTAGILNSQGGTFAVAPHANEKAFIDAVDFLIARMRKEQS